VPVPGHLGLDSFISASLGYGPGLVHAGADEYQRSGAGRWLLPADERVVRRDASAVRQRAAGRPR